MNSIKKEESNKKINSLKELENLENIFNIDKQNCQNYKSPKNVALSNQQRSMEIE